MFRLKKYRGVYLHISRHIKHNNLGPTKIIHDDGDFFTVLDFRIPEYEAFDVNIGYAYRFHKRETRWSKPSMWARCVHRGPRGTYYLTSYECDGLVHYHGLNHTTKLSSFAIGENIKEIHAFCQSLKFWNVQM